MAHRSRRARRRHGSRQVWSGESGGEGEAVDSVSIYEHLRAATLRLAGAVAVLAVMVGMYCVENPAQAHEWRICGFPVGCNYLGNAIVTALPATSVTLPGGSPLDIEIYTAVILALGAGIAVAAFVCAARPTLVRRVMLGASAALLALSLVVFYLPPPTASVLVKPYPCFAPSCFAVMPYPQGGPPILSVWYMVPAAALGLLAVGLGLLPARPSVRVVPAG